ncbi:cell cycle and apoptosis regulator protein 2 [Crotalus tigris]|uniref:cell cycle and apoptosis regulator protein 2 n=1 Tax=Crotalus tigris TaxID=88082 RepID=UPI00192F7CF6|nr:cell cycle and apoptosis regulator protein 2 [Crotalus tigris]XP_039210223.1 cell cycle and apoptosis regulator protein 2 [Crotalus tigris]XP_039210224.1 cell cycle and apoptosis regulator protein 2 [Crotalus tigris]
MAQFKRQKPLRTSSLQGARSFSGTQPASLLGPAPGLLNPPISADIIQAARHLQGGEKQRVFTGIVTSLHDYFGVVDDEVFFQLSVVKGRIPQIGEKVLVKAVYNPSQSVPWNALKVQTLSNQPLLKPPTPLLHVASLGQKQGILGAQPQLLFQPHRIPPLFPQKPMSLFQTSPSLHLGHLGRYAGRGPKGRQESGRWDDFDSKKRKQKGNEPWGAKKPRHEPPQYRVQLACYTVNSPFCDAMEVLRRYCSIQLPKEFYDVRLCWLDTFPLSQPLTLKHPSRIQVTGPAEESSQAEEDTRQEAEPEDANPAFSAKVLLLSSPGIEEFYRNCLLYIEEPSDQREIPEHPTKQIKFLLEKKADELVLLGGEWSPSLDGPDPATSPTVLIRTAVRCVKAQIGLDLSTCTKWYRFAEFRYLREGNPSCQEQTVVFLPDLWSLMPSLEEWEASCKQKTEQATLPLEEKSETVEETEQTSEPGPEQEMESCEQEMDSAEPVPEPALETSASEPETPTPPLEPAIVVCSQLALRNGQPSCTNVSLYTLLEYRRQREKLSFEVAVVAETFQEMLQRDFGYKLYKALLALPEKEEPPEAKNPDAEKGIKSEKEAENELKEEPQEKPGAEDTPGSNQKEVQREGTGEAKKPPNQDGANSTKEEKVSGNVKAEAKDSTNDLCELSMEDDLLLLREDEEEDFGVKLEDAEVRSVASNQSEIEISSLPEMPRELDPSTVLPLDALLAFVYFDLNFCGYLHRKDMDKILLTLGLHLCKEQVKRLVNRVVTQFVCRYRSLHYSRQEGTEAGLEEEELSGNLNFLRSSASFTKSTRETQSTNLISYNGAVLNVSKLLEKAEQTENSRLYLENKIHALELKLEETQLRFSSTEASNKALTAEVQELQKRLTEMEEQSKVSEKQKSHFQRLLQENKKRLVPLHLEIQKIIEKTNNCLEKKEATSPSVSSN